MKYIKFDENKKVIEVAPSFKGTIVNYNIESNKEMLLNDGYEKHETEYSYEGIEYIKGYAPMQTLSEKASSISMTKAEFLLLITSLTSITLSQIEEYTNSSDEIKIRFTYANTVERDHPLLDSASEIFGITSELLDIMFVNKDELIAKINAGEPIEGI